MPSDDWKAELGKQRLHYGPNPGMRRAAWAAMLDATSGLALADHLIKTLPRSHLRAIVAEWIGEQDFADAMSGVEADEDAVGGEDDA